MSSNTELAEQVNLILKNKENKLKVEELKSKLEVVKATTAEFPNLEKIILPPGMSYGTASEVLKSMEASEQKKVAVFRAFHGIPADCLIAMWTALQSRFGFSALKDTDTFFGPQPPFMVTLPIGVGQTTTVPYGKISPPAWEGGFIMPELTRDGSGINIIGEVKQKFVDAVNGIMDAAEQLLIDSSIYKGKAIDLDLSYLSGRKVYDPTTMSPVFIPNPSIRKKDLILNPDARMMFDLNVFSRLEQREYIASLGIRFKYGVLLSGPFGCGKTQSAAVIQNLATENGISFINLKTPEYFAQALEVARRYGPTVLFVEDIDVLFRNEERDVAINDILNNLDGVRSKDGFEVLVILTTNNIQAISSAMLRAGRIDALITMEYPNRETVSSFINHFSNGRIERNICEDPQIQDTLANRAPAFIHKIVSEAILQACLRDRSHPVVTKDDLLLLAQQCIKHEDYARKKEESPIDKVSSALDVLRDELDLNI